MMRRRFFGLLAILAVAGLTLQAGSTPQRARLGMVITQNAMASQIGFDVIKSGGNAIDAVVATAFALAVVHPTAGNIGGGGFIVYRPATGEPMSFDFREMGAARSSPEMWLKDGKYSSQVHPTATCRSVFRNVRSYTWRGRSGIETWKALSARHLLARDGLNLTAARSLARPCPASRNPGVARAVLEERRAVRRRRDAEAARPREDAHADRRERPGGFL